MLSLTQIHKDDISLRLIISRRYPACHPLRRIFLDIFNPLADKSKSFEKDTRRFTQLNKDSSIRSNQTVCQDSEICSPKS